MKKAYLFMACAGLLWTSCNKNESKTQDVTLPIEILVVNEGVYGHGTGSVSAIYYDGTSDADVFQMVNDRVVGEVPLHLAYMNGYYFLTVNVSSKIEVIHPKTMKSQASIQFENETEPRYIQQISPGEAVVSDIMNNQLVLIDLNNFTVKQYINTAYSYEHLAVCNDKLFAATDDKVIMYDLGDIQYGSERMVNGIDDDVMFTADLLVDKNNKVWVMTVDDSWSPTLMKLNCIDPALQRVVKKIEIPFVQPGDVDYVDGAVIGIAPMNHWDIDRSGSTIYFYADILKDGNAEGAILRLNVDEYTYEPEPYRILNDLGMIYSFGISPDNEVFVGDCIEWGTHRGYLREYKANGTVTSTRVGYYPSQIHFTAYNQ